MAYRESRVVRGIFRILDVLFVLTCIVGIVCAYVANAPAAPYAYTDFSSGEIVQMPGKAFNVGGFTLFSAVWCLVAWTLQLVIIWIINGFREKDPS